jgi:hypothetical protein
MIFLLLSVISRHLKFAIFTCFKYSESLFLSLQTPANKKTPWPESASELYLPSDRRLSANLVPTFADRACHMGSVTNPQGRNLGLLDRKTAANEIVKYGLEFCWTWSRESGKAQKQLE